MANQMEVPAGSATTCPRCDFPNPPGANFCLNCGSSLAQLRPCPNCATPLPPGARFCPNCGIPLPARSEAPAPGPVEKRNFQGERRVVTLLFCDVKGSTSLAEKLDPEEWAEIMNAAYERLIGPVYRYEGTVARLMGDAVLAFFGAPIAHEDDPLRAVRAGLEMLAGIRDYRKQVLQSRGLDFDVRVGIHTGLVVVGEMGSDQRLEYSAMGDSINLAARMEQTASPGTIQITRETYQAAGSALEVEALGEVQVKGKSRPIPTYRVLGLRGDGAPGRETASFAAPFLGRAAELEQLRLAAAAARGSRGGIVCLVGEAGSGKSRLIAEFRAEWERSFVPGGKWDEIRAVSHGGSRPYEQFRQHLLEFSGLKGDEPPEVVRQKLDAMLAFASPEKTRQVVPMYLALFGLDAGQGGAPATGQAGESFQRRLFDAVLELLRLRNQGAPSVIVLDDLQWMDPASTRLFTYQLQMVVDLPVLFICAFRPDLGPAGRQIQQAAQERYPDQYREIRLGPLDEAHSRALIQALLERARLPGRLQPEILSKSDGNPFFIQEVVRSLAEAGPLIPEGEGQGPVLARLSIPGSLQSLVLARLDRLPDEARRALQAAAVIGRSFPTGLLQAILEPQEPIEPALAALENAGLICPTGDETEPAYAFVHALTQEVAYESNLHKRRRDLHLRVAEALLELSPGSPDGQAALLAFHFDQAGDPRALRYYRLAGDEAARLYANQEAHAAYSRALELGEEAPAAERTGLLRARANVSYFLGRIEETLSSLETALVIARAAGLLAEEARVLAQLAWASWRLRPAAESIALARLAQERAQQTGDQRLSLRAAVILGTALQNEGDLPEAYQQLRRSFSLARRLEDPKNMATSLAYLAMVCNFTGRFGRSARLAKLAAQLFLSLDDRRAACSARYTEALAEGGRSRYDAALAALEAGLRLAEEVVSPWTARYPNQRAWLSAELGDWEHAYELDRAGLEQAQRVAGFREFEISTRINLARDCLALEQYGEAGEHLAATRQNLGHPEFGLHNWRWRTRLAEVETRFCLAHHNLSQAQASLERLEEWAARTQARKYLAIGQVLQARLHLAQDQAPESGPCLLRSLRLGERTGYLPVQLETLCLLRDMYAGQGDGSQAAAAQAGIDRRLQQLSGELRHPELRQSFERGLLAQFARQ